MLGPPAVRWGSEGAAGSRHLMGPQEKTPAGHVTWPPPPPRRLKPVERVGGALGRREEEHQTHCVGYQTPIDGKDHFRFP